MSSTSPLQRPPGAPTGRHQARKYAIDLLFEAEARSITPRQAAHLRHELAQQCADIHPPPPYTMTVTKGVTQHYEHINDLLTSHLQSWTLERLPAVDRAILRVAIWELLYSNDVPEAVIVNEAVQLAKELSTDESPAFVNGVLGQLMLITPSLRPSLASPSSEKRPE